MSILTTPSETLAITDEQHAIARAYVTESIEELLCWSDLAELLAEPFSRPERDHPSEREVHQLAKIEGIPLRHTLRLDDETWQRLIRENCGAAEGASDVLEVLRERDKPVDTEEATRA